MKSATLILPIALLAMLALLTIGCTSEESDSSATGSSPTSSPVVTPPAAPAEIPPAPAATATTPASDDQPVFILTGSGGCSWGGRCPRFLVRASGTVETSAADPDRARPSNITQQTYEATGVIDAETLNRWLDVVETTDIEALIERAGPGIYAAAVDGTDLVLEIPHTGAVLSSIEVSFYDDEEFFAVVFEMARAASEAAPLPQR